MFSKVMSEEHKYYYCLQDTATEGRLGQHLPIFFEQNPLIFHIIIFD